MKRVIEDGRRVELLQQLFNWKLVISPAGPLGELCYTDGW